MILHEDLAQPRLTEQPRSSLGVKSLMKLQARQFRDLADFSSERILHSLQSVGPRHAILNPLR
jgi:hypothetical protein